MKIITIESSSLVGRMGLYEWMNEWRTNKWIIALELSGRVDFIVRYRIDDSVPSGPSVNKWGNKKAEKTKKPNINENFLKWLSNIAFEYCFWISKLEWT